MHKLDRDPMPPVGLSRYRHGIDHWAACCPTAAERSAIWQALHAMQGERCAYCEAALGEHRCHIEHFRQRAAYPAGTFEWSNLFGSCNRLESCGRHKDGCGKYLHTDLIKPDEEDPEHFFVFSPNGSVSPRSGLSADERHRACETIRIFNLNGALEEIRSREVRGYLQTAEEFAHWAEELPQDQWLPIFEEELERVTRLPFATAIRHVLTRQD